MLFGGKCSAGGGRDGMRRGDVCRVYLSRTNLAHPLETASAATSINIPPRRLADVISRRESIFKLARQFQNFHALNEVQLIAVNTRSVPAATSLVMYQVA